METHPTSPENAFEFLFRRDIEFRQETIYFMVVDRFNDGDKTNNEGPNASLYDPERKDWHKYWGGDLQGVIDKLDYLKGMGITAIWMTPLFEQVEELVANERAAIHGYWPRDFKRINPRFLGQGENPSLSVKTQTTFDRLVAELHRRGMKLILDIVCNHSNPDAGGTKGQLFDDGKLIADFNNDGQAHWYHHYGEVTDWNDEWQVKNCELGGLATFNENNADYRHYIKSAIKLWLDRGVDSLRVDTVKHMPQWFWQEFVGDILVHRPDVFIFGEWIYSHPADEQSVPFANNAGMSILDFAFCMALRRGLAKNEEGGFQLFQAVLDLDCHYNNVSELVTFIDNHDMHRFQSLNADTKVLHLAIVLLILSRGIPCLFYGTEQELHNDTNSEDGLAHGNNDPYNRPMMEKWDTNAPIYVTTAKLSELRRENPAISLGAHIPQHLAAEVYAFTRRYRDSRCFVAMNKSSETVTIESVKTDLEDGPYECVLTGRKVDVKDGHLTGLALAAQEALVFNYVGSQVTGQTIARARVNGLSTKPGEVVIMTGSCPELGEWDVQKGYPLEYINSNTWFAEVPLNESAGKLIAYKYVIVRVDEHQIPVGQPERENVVCRRRIVPREGIVKWRDHWGSKG